MSQVKVVVGGGVALGFKGKYIYVRYQKLPEGSYSRGDHQTAAIMGCDFVAVRVLLLSQ